MLLKIPKIIALTASVLTLWVFLFGVFGFGLGMGMNSPTAICLFGGHSESICKINTMGHLQEWQGLFATLPAKEALSFLFTFLTLLVLLSLGIWKKLIAYNQFWPEIHINSFYLKKYQIFDYLKEAFSNGTLNPKTF